MMGSMSSAILATKLQIPVPRPRRVLRQRLTDRLDAPPRPRLALISAPPGFGKSTVAGEWAAASGRRVAWLSLDEADADPLRFLASIVAALRVVEPGLGANVLERLQATEAPPESVAADLLNEIAGLTHELALVLDDYHAVDSRSCDAALTFVLDHAPPQLQVVITTREDPQLPLARYRSRGQLVELREADLRFTAAEAAEFLSDVMDLALTPEDVAALESRTEGWIVGLQLAALSMQGVADAPAFIRSFTGTHRFVLDYLLEEVLHRQPEPIQEFLLGTSILDRLTGPLCDAVLPDRTASGQDTLERLDRANLFLTPLDHERRWYRHHQLFAALLRDRLARTQPDRIATLHQRASDWFAGNDLPAEAVEHAIAARDWARAADVIERFSDEWPMRAGIPTTLGWLESLPAELRLDRPALGLTYGWNLFLAGQLDRADRFLGQLGPLVAGQPHFLGEVYAIRVMVAANRRDTPAVIGLADEARSRLPADAASPRSRIAISVGVALLEYGGDLGSARDAFSEALDQGRADAVASPVGNAPLPLTALAYLAEIEWLQGDLRAASRTYDEAHQLAIALGGQPSIALSLVQLGRAGLFYEWDDLDGAARAVEEAMRVGASWRNPRVLVPALGLTASIAQARDAWDEARAALGRASEVARDAPTAPLVQVTLCVHQLAQSVAARDWRIVDRWQRYHDAEEAKLPPRIDAALAAGLAHAWIARHRGRRDEAALHRARSLVDHALEAARRDGIGLYAVRLGTLDALLRLEEGRPDEALASLGDALEAARPAGYRRSFLDLGEPAAGLLRRGLETKAWGEAVAEYARELLARFGQPSTPPSGAAAWPLVEPLSPRELDVLRLIAEGLSNREIAGRLFLAVSTVKGHARVIFGKLDVERRTEAVARARVLGIL